MCELKFLEYQQHTSNAISLGFLVGINIVAASVAATSNCIVIYTITKRPSLRGTPSNILILGLAVSDLGVALFTQPCYCVYKLAEVKGDAGLFCLFYRVYMLTLFSFGTVSLATLTAITVDRFLAIHLHLRYQEQATTKRYVRLLAFLWLVSLFTGLIKFFDENNRTSIAGFVLFVCTLLVNIVCIFKIARIVQRHSRQIRAQQDSLQFQAQQQSVYQSLDMSRYKRSVNTMYFVVGAFILCYVQNIIALIPYSLVKEHTSNIHILYGFSETFLMFNSVFNPFIYCWRIKEIRNTARLIWRRIWCSSEMGTPG